MDRQKVLYQYGSHGRPPAHVSDKTILAACCCWYALVPIWSWLQILTGNLQPTQGLWILSPPRSSSPASVHAAQSQEWSTFASLSEFVQLAVTEDDRARMWTGHIITYSHSSRSAWVLAISLGGRRCEAGMHILVSANTDCLPCRPQGWI